jgi:cysteine desulfurase/selenocysteine lyase
VTLTAAAPTGPTIAPAPAYDVERVRADFPILSRRVHDDRPLVYLDSAATSQKPTAVLAAMDDYYRRHNAAAHRGIHVLAEEATDVYEGARDKVAALLHAPDRREVVFTKNATESINLVAYCLGNAAGFGGRGRLGPGDEILVTEMEHHSNLVPWQLLAQRTGATLRWIPVSLDGRLELDDLDALLTERTRIVAFVHQSNILGTVNPVETIVARAREVGALVLLDACQSVPHGVTDVRALGVDFLAFSGHKMCGPTGIGVLWGRYDLLAQLPPFLGGGSMIAEVTMAGSTYAEPPQRFEAGVPMIAEAAGLSAAVEYLGAIGLDAVAAHERALTGYALQRLAGIDGLRIIGPATTEDRGGAISFVLDGIHPHDVGQLLDETGVAVRVGHHCVRPVCQRFGIPATTRASFYLYTTYPELDALVDGVERARKFFG